jgi:tetratricopeptide (TPR) repeat protein
MHLAGEFAWEAGMFEEAEKHLRRAYTVGPDVGRNGERLAQFLAGQGRIGEALEIARDARRHLPEDPALERLIQEFTN